MWTSGVVKGQISTDASVKRLRWAREPMVRFRLFAKHHSEDEETLASDKLHDYLNDRVIRKPIQSRRPNPDRRF